MVTVQKLSIEVTLSVKEFFDFLEANHALTRYVHNFRLDIRQGPKSPLFFFKHKKANVRVTEAFTWSSTPEGFDFWHKVQKSWAAKLRVQEIIDRYRKCIDNSLDSGTEVTYSATVNDEDIHKVFDEKITGSWIKVTDLSWNRAVTDYTVHASAWASIGEGELKSIPGTCLVLSEPEPKKITYSGTWDFIQIWIPELNRAQYVLFKPSYLVQHP